MGDSALRLETPEQEEISGLNTLNDDDLQAYLLEGVSRTFALTIPQLPADLQFVVSNAYLLCRTVDTIEDEPNLSPEQKRAFCERFVKVVKGGEDPTEFANDLAPALSANTIPFEHHLIRLTKRVVAITHSLDEPQRAALERCVSIMSEGMAYFQENVDGDGLSDLKELDKYCYYVAGVVGEMLTDLFCHHSPEVARNYNGMSKLSVSFGQGLQMTNILKDIWDDLDRSACWLPKDIFSSNGFELSQLKNGKKSEAAFEEGLIELIGITHAHLVNAFNYTLMIPRKEEGIRKFCLWALGMAVLTLKKINQNKDFENGNEVKISRRSVKNTIIATQLTAKNDLLLRALFNFSRTGLPLNKKVIISAYE